MATTALAPASTVDISPSRSRVYPSLDGLRALSIVLVFLGHLYGSRNYGRPEFGIGDYAHLGVTVFFVISGFLITSLLIAEYNDTGGIALKLFYARRSLRIFPAAYAFIAVMSLMVLARTIHLCGSDLWHAITYTVNYDPHRSWHIGHLWSLSIEEQFYLLWPCVFASVSRRSAVAVASAMVLLGPVARAAAWVFFRGTPYLDLEMFPMVADSIAVGCVLALQRTWLERQTWYLRLFHPAWSVAIVAAVLLLNRLMMYTVVSVGGRSVANVLLAILIHRCVYCPVDSVGRILNWKPVAAVGALSYSLYLWQQPFLNARSTQWWNAFPQNVIFTVIAAGCSYTLLERPLMKFRHRLRA